MQQLTIKKQFIDVLTHVKNALVNLREDVNKYTRQFEAVEDMEKCATLDGEYIDISDAITAIDEALRGARYL